MPLATNPNTGETMYLDDGGTWKPAQTAVNPETKQMLAFDGKNWSPVNAKSNGILNYIDDAVRSIANGATFGFADEIAAKANELTGRGTYDTNVKAERERDAQIPAAIKYPGEVAGAVAALPVGGIAKGATMGARALQAAKVGGVYGALSGAGAGENTNDRAAGAAIGAVGGAVLGGVSAPIVEGAIQGAKTLASPIVNAARGAVNPSDEAARRVATAIARDARADPNAVNRLTPTEFGQNAQPGGPAIVMDMGGETTRALARSAANTSPEGRQLLNNTINDRFEGQAGRVSQWLRGAFNYPDARAQQQAIDQVEKTVNRVNYKAAYQEGDKPLWSPELERLTNSPAVQDALKSAVTTGKDRAVNQGFGGFKPPINITVDGQLSFNKGPNGVTTYPNLQFWDSARRELSDAASAANRSGRKEEAARLGDLSRALNSELDNLVPSYQKARSGAAGFFGAENALEAGQNFVMQKMANSEARQALAKMSEPERRLFQDGFVSRYIETLNATGDRRSILNTVAASPEAREKLQIALGPQKANQLEMRLRVEGIMDLARSAVQGNSTTARQLAELGFAGGAGSLGAHGAYTTDPKEMTFAVVAGALLAGKKGIDYRVAQQVARLLVSQDVKMVSRGIDLISKNSRLMDSLRIADRKIAASGSQQIPTGSIPALQAPSTGRAEDQQQVPGPPGQ